MKDSELAECYNGYSNGRATLPGNSQFFSFSLSLFTYTFHSLIYLFFFPSLFHCIYIHHPLNLISTTQSQLNNYISISIFLSETKLNKLYKYIIQQYFMQGAKHYFNSNTTKRYVHHYRMYLKERMKQKKKKHE